MTAGGVRVRPAVDGDAGELLTVQRAAFVAEAQRYGDPFLPPMREDLDAVRAVLTDPAVVVLVAATASGRLVGGVRVRLDGDVGHVGRLAVAPDRQREGIGTALLTALEEALPPSVHRLALFTGGRSTATVARYERAGYVRVQREPSVDDRGVPLAHLEKELRPPA
ncbi:GNAT family N-acetyltransferase [Kineococcus endophyticus]|uniref:GNAT family N-acetyltransferase n=1 Tax=Kineococcus endophyticus TaxID=1181883 RepID=A0ABV3P9J7_9ACTN